MPIVGGFQVGMTPGDVGRVVQGLLAGIGFLGGGVILKNPENNTVRNLTTAAGIWVTASVGILAGLGRAWTAILATVLRLVVLDLVRRLEERLEESRKGVTKRDSSDR
jgi:putative Mg2+ transporter-C (MgtC) family protein